MKKPAIPAVQGVQDPAVIRLLAPIKENIELMTGVREGTIQQLSSDADLATVISKINEIIRKLNAYD